jgi:hypothetical protein
MDDLPIEFRSNLEHGEHTFGGDVPIAVALKEKRTEVAIVNDDIDLLAGVPPRVKYEGARNLVAVGQELSQQLPPGTFADVALGGWM